MRWIERNNRKKYAEENSKGPPVRVIEASREHKRNRSPPPVRRLVLSKVEGTEACRGRDKPVEATDVVFRLVMRDSNVHRCGQANSVLEHNKPHTSTVVEAGVEEAVTNVIVWPSTDAGRPGLASSMRTPGNICRCRMRTRPTSRTIRERHCRCNDLDSRVFLPSLRRGDSSTKVLSYLASGLEEDKENSLPFRRGSPCCDLFEGPDNRQLREGYSARRRQEALTNFPITLNPRLLRKNNARPVRGKKGISLPFRRGSPCCDLFEGPDNRQLLEGYSARRRQEASNESFLPRTEVGSLSGR